MTTLEKPTQEAVSDAAPVETAAGQVVPEAAPAGAQPGSELLWGFFNDETDIKLCRWGFVAGVGVWHSAVAPLARTASRSSRSTMTASSPTAIACG